MISRTDSSMITIFKDIYEYLKSKNFMLKLHVLNNECSKSAKKYITNAKVNIQLVEPYFHLVHTAKPAVKTAKYHIMIAGLATIDKSCLL